MPVGESRRAFLSGPRGLGRVIARPGGRVPQTLKLARDMGMGMVVVTHNLSLAARADRTLVLADGRVVETDVGEGVY